MRKVLLQIGALHPRMPERLLDGMVAVLDDLHSRINVDHSFGGMGSPWEFNLRDLLRWCDLAEGAIPQPATGYGTFPGPTCHMSRTYKVQYGCRVYVGVQSFICPQC